MDEVPASPWETRYMPGPYGRRRTGHRDRRRDPDPGERRRRSPTPTPLPEPEPDPEPPPAPPPFPEVVTEIASLGYGYVMFTYALSASLALVYTTNSTRGGNKFARFSLWCLCLGGCLENGGATSLPVTRQEAPIYLLPWFVASSLFAIYGLLNWHQDHKAGGPEWPANGYEATVRATAEALMLEAMAFGTNAMYDLGWQQWLAYNRLRGSNPFLSGTTREEKRHDEDELLLYVVHVGVTLKRASSTVKIKITAVRQGHILAGFADPLEDKKRLTLALKGLERRNGRGRRKLPTTTGMLKWWKGTLDVDGDPNDALQWFAIVMAFFFLMRIGEYAFSGRWDLKKVLTPSSLQFRKDGCIVSTPAEADEILLHFKGSKADQEAVGATRSHYRHDGELCVVRAAEKMYKHFGHRFRTQRDQPLFRWADGTPFTREQVQAILERAAVAEGLPANRFRSHSLRIGGATALYHIFHDVDIIKRYGRWSSGAFQGYLWDANETAKGIAEKMANDVTSIHFDPS